MKHEMQMEAMARIDGWTIVGHDTGRYSAKPPNEPRMSNTWLTEELATGDYPDYTTDNEIDRMVRGLPDDKLVTNYIGNLTLICCRDGVRWIHQATEAQKVEAFLKAHGKWADDREAGDA